MRSLVPAALTVGALAFSIAAPAVAADVPGHPRDLTYPELDFEVPRAEGYRHELPGGIVAYVVEDHSLPLVDVGVQVRVGSFLEPASKVGLANLTGVLMRTGGTATLSPEELDERADFLAADLFTSIGSTSGNARMNCLTSVLEECLDLFFEIMKQPRFDQARLDLEKQNTLERLKQRNDDPQRIASREWQWLMYGDEHFTSRYVTGASLEAITRDDLVEFHRAYWRPQNMIVTVSGDVEPESVLELLAARFAGWSNEGAEEVTWPPPEPRFVPKPGLYVAEKEIPQGRVRIGHLGTKRESWEDPEAPAIAVMNDILGGGGFTSRVTKRIRSDEGLAYSAGTTFGVGTFWPGTFFAFFQSKSPTVALAAKIALEEIERIRREPVSDEELATSKSSFIETFPGNFDSARTVANLFAGDEYLGRPHEYWYSYRERISSVTKDDVLRVAKERLHPDEVVMLVVGDWEEIQKGDPDGRAKLSELFAGDPVMLPERDPVTLEPVGQ